MCFMYSYSISQDISKVFFIVKYPAYAFVAQMLYFYFQKKKKKRFFTTLEYICIGLINSVSAGL